MYHAVGERGPESDWPSKSSGKLVVGLDEAAAQDRGLSVSRPCLRREACEENLCGGDKKTVNRIAAASGVFPALDTRADASASGQIVRVCTQNYVIST